MPDIISWPGDLATLQNVRDRLRSGQLIGLATDAGYEALASALDDAAVGRLAAFAESDVPVAILLRSPNDIFGWLPHCRGACLRLARDFWPGPLVLVSSLGLPYGLAARLSAAAKKHLVRSDGVALRLAPRDDLIHLLMALEGPLAIASLGKDAAAKVDARLEYEAVDPPAKTTVVAATERDLRLLREGDIRPAELEASARAKIVFVCTGNTCRSPMAEVLCQRLLADTLGIAVNELAAHGYVVESAGIAAGPGEQASPEAVAVAQALGGDLSRHASQPLTMELVDRADHLFTMTAGHLRMLHSLRLPVGPEPQLLSAWGEDVPDPIGGPLELYQACAEQIRSSLRERLPQILEG
jgi:protein-tyrosine-phosphatase/tRNA A37 threonylcarbamoyladenosine synthetase subunit TsaC/SUA5/YrdC